MSVTKKHTWEPVTDISLEADKSPGDCWNNSEPRRGPSQGGPARGTPGGGSEEASGTSPAHRGCRAGLRGWERSTVLCRSGREDDTLPGEGQCQWRVMGRAWGLRSVQSGVWAQRLCQDHGEQGSAPQADGRGRGELLEARAPRFLRRAQAPRPHTPEMPQKSQHATAQTAHFRQTARAANAGTGNGAPARPRASRVPGRVRQQPPRSHPSPA